MMDVEKLKQKILDLAIRGKLVPQDSNDEPASVLIERIRTEKEELIKQGKIKRDKNESYIFKGDDNSYYEKVCGETICIDNELPFEIPKNWMWARLGSIGNWGAGSTPLRSNLNYYNNGTIPWLKTGELNDGIIRSTEEHITELALKECSLRINPIGSVLIAMYGATIGKLAIAGIDLTTNQACCACQVSNAIVNQYLFFFLQAIKSLLIKKGAGGAQPNISREIIVGTLIPIPPKEEQNRILKKLSFTLDKIRQLDELNKDVKKLSSQLKYKILDLFFGENSRYKSYYENELKLGDILEYEQPAKYIVNSTEYSNEYTTPVLTPGKTFILGYTNEKDGIYKVNGKKVIIFDDFTTASRLIDFDFKVKSSTMKILTVSNENLYDTEYVYLLLQTIHVNNNTHKRYWISDFATRNVKIHSIQEQKKIVREITKIYTIIEKVIG